MDFNDKKIPIIIGGVTVLVGGAALAYYLTHKSSFESKPPALSSLLTEIPYQIPAPTLGEDGTHMEVKTNKIFQYIGRNEHCLLSNTIFR
jgi:hypothetical protein